MGSSIMEEMRQAPLHALSLSSLGSVSLSQLLSPDTLTYLQAKLLQSSPPGYPFFIILSEQGGPS